MTYFVAIFAKKKNLKNKKKLKHFDSDQLYKTKMIDLSEELGMFAQRTNWNGPIIGTSPKIPNGI